MQSVEDVLKDSGIDYVINPNKPSELTVRCFSGLHVDTNPSLSLNLEKGAFHCFACGHRGNTQQFLDSLGIKSTVQIASKMSFKIKKLKSKLDNIKYQGEVRLPEPTIAINHDFKGISAKTLKNFGAFFTDASGLSDYACIPVYQHKKLKFIEGRYKVLSNSGGFPKYLRKPAGASVSDILFPLDKIADFSHVILVEGMFDMLKLHDLGYTNSLCIFGTQNFTAQKAKLLDEYGCRKVTILMDGDSAGKQAAAKIQKLLEQRNIETNNIVLSEGLDPGSFNKETAEYFLGNIEDNL
jgi:DNA primase